MRIYTIQLHKIAAGVLSFFSVAAGSSCKDKPHLENYETLISHINVVDVISGEIRKNQNIAIGANKISIISSEPIDANFHQEIKGNGKYIIPGLWDMHAHPDDPEVWRMNPKEYEKDLLMPLFVVYGVTGIRDMGGDIELVKRWRTKSNNQELLAPKMYAGGPLLDGPNPMWDGSVGINGPDEVKKVVDSLIAAGVDFLKVYSLLPRDTYLALSEYSREIGYPFVGHVPFTVTPSEAAITGMKSQEHLLEILKECAAEPSEGFLKKVRAMENGVDRSTKINNFRLANFDEKKADSLYKLFVKEQIWHCPTLSMWRKNAWYEEELQKDSQLLGLLPEYLQAYWTPDYNDHLKYRDNDEFIATKKRLYELYLKMVNRMNQAGVLLLAGTDTGANPLCHPGEGVHNELEEFIIAGLTPLEALKTATINPALFFEIENDYGTVDVGKVADLIILDANPLEYISNVRKISTVIRDGKVITSEKIAQIKDSIRAAHKNMKN